MSASANIIATLNQRVSIEQRSEALMPEGGHAVVFVPVATVWARVHARPGAFQIESDARASGATHQIVLRHRRDVSPGDRFVWGARKFEILWAEDLEGKTTFLTCGCTETRGIG